MFFHLIYPWYIHLVHSPPQLHKTFINWRNKSMLKGQNTCPRNHCTIISCKLYWNNVKLCRMLLCDDCKHRLQPLVCSYSTRQQNFFLLGMSPVSYTHLRAHETDSYLV